MTTLTPDDVRRIREEAIEKLTAAASEMDRLESEWHEKRREWYATCLDAFNSGCTYDQIAAYSKRSRIRIAGVLKAERQRRGEDPEE